MFNVKTPQGRGRMPAYPVPDQESFDRWNDPNRKGLVDSALDWFDRANQDNVAKVIGPVLDANNFPNIPPKGKGGNGQGSNGGSGGSNGGNGRK